MPEPDAHLEPGSSPRPRILCLDDEPNVLAALERQLQRDYEVYKATDASAAIQILTRDGPFPVVVSDLRMPNVDGISFLAKVAEESPDTVRILLTGYADLDAAVVAVNRGRVFRFLTKPCRKEDLLAAIAAGFTHYELVHSERELLGRTLRGTIRTLADVLALTSPLAFGRARRARETVMALCAKLHVEDTWPIECAALLSQIGCISLTDATLERMHLGDDLDARERADVARLPDVARALLRNVPRLEPVLEILQHQEARFAGDRRGGPGPHGEAIPLGARLLHAALDLDAVERRGTRGSEAIAVLRGRRGEYDPAVLDALAALHDGDDEGREIHELRLVDLKVGMILTEDVVARSGALLLARGQAISESSILRLRAYSENGDVFEPMMVAIPSDLPVGEEEEDVALSSDDVVECGRVSGDAEFPVPT